MANEFKIKHSLLVPLIKLTTDNTESLNEGEIRWDASEQAIKFGTSSGNTILSNLVYTNVVNTFSEFPVTPSSSPTGDYQVANKKYVDDSLSGISSENTAKTINQSSHGFDNDFIYHNGTTWVKAQANNDTTLATHFAQNIDTNNFNLIAIGEVDVTGMTDDESSSLTTGEYYFLSQTVSGKITKTIPSSGLVQSVLKINSSNNATVMISEGYNTDTNSYVTTTGSQTLTNKTFDDELNIKQITTPSNPSSGYNKLYFKSDNELYKLDSSGTESIVGGSSGGNLSVISKTGNYTLTTDDDVVECNGSFTITLPTISGNSGKVFRIHNIGTGTITIDANGSETINGQLSVINNIQYDTIALCAGSSGWIII